MADSPSNKLSPAFELALEALENAVKRAQLSPGVKVEPYRRALRAMVKQMASDAAARALVPRSVVDG